MEIAKNECAQSGDEALKLNVSKNEQFEQTDFLRDATNSAKVKVASVIFG